MSTERASSPEIAEQLLQLSIGYMPAVSFNIVARLEIADQLRNGPKSVEDIGNAVGAHPGALYRVMRALTTVGVFKETGNREFANTPASELLRRDHPDSVRDMVVWIADPFH